jgi:predicted site-specific integrase-resolvase
MSTISGTLPVLTPKQIADRLGISERSVREKAYTGAWPHLRLDQRTLRFTESDYREILASGHRSTTTPVRSVTLTQRKEELAALLTSRRAA